ncbi:MAG: hypothetical protein H0T42_27910 [Deltaproteobacteria bacterium]|nr:hypothetical protein [Deltaproteobacteria bacterium]
MERSTSRFGRIALAVLLASCGGKDDGATKGKDDATVGPQVAPLAVPTSGVDQIKRMNFVYGDGYPAFDKATDAYKKKELDEARKLAELSIAKDPMHLDAHYLLARVLGQAGEHAAAVDHLVTALAGDYWRYGPGLAKDTELGEFMSTPHGQSIATLAGKLRDDYAKRIASGLWVIGRRSSFKWPKDPGVQPATSRGELYAFDRDSRRYFRLTHTDHKVAAYVRAASGAEIAILGFDKVNRPKLDLPSTFAAVWVQVIETKEWQPVGKKVALGAAREVSVGYGANDQLIVTVDGVTSAVDQASGKLSKVETPPPVPRAVLTIDDGRLVRAADGIMAAWSGEPATATSLKAGAGATIAIPESGAAAQASIAVAPGGARVVFATAVDPCAKTTAPSLYIADAKTGVTRHVLTARSRFGTRWLDANLVAYEDGEGGVRVWNAVTSREEVKLDNKPGIALDVLSLSSAPSCKQTPVVVDPVGAGSADEPPLPPEEPASGPVTQPN